MKASFFRATGGLRLSAIPLLVFAAACAEGSTSDMLSGDTLNNGGSAGDTAIGGSATSGTGGDTVVPMAGSAPLGGGGMMTTAGTTSGAGAGGGGAGGAGGMGGGGAGGMGGGGMGGKAGSGGGGAGGMGATGFRYVRLLATSEQAGKVWSSVAELDLYTTGGAAIPKTGWVATADSQETDDENVPASNAIDGNISTFWHTAWEPAPDDVNDAPLPHQLVIDLGSAKPITGFQYTPRQDGPNGRIGAWQFFVSNNNSNWGNAVKSGTFPAGTTATKETF